MRAFLEPFPELARRAHHPILHINFVRLIARECRVESRQNSVGQEFLEVRLVEEIAFLALRAEEKPRLAARPDRLPFLQESAEGRNTRARPDHYDRQITIFGQAEF